MRTVQLSHVHAHHIQKGASSVNQLILKDSTSISRFAGGPSSDNSSSSPCKKPNTYNGGVESTKFTNKEYRNARNFNNLYDHLNVKHRDIKDKERLGIRSIQGDRLLPPFVELPSI